MKDQFNQRFFQWEPEFEKKLYFKYETEQTHTNAKLCYAFVNEYACFKNYLSACVLNDKRSLHVRLV